MKSYNDIPVGKLFTYEGDYYFYDTYTNMLLSISKEHYLEIRNLQEIGITEYKSLAKPSTAYSDVVCLMDKGLLRSDFISDVVHPLNDIIADLCERCLNDLSLQVTKDCNFKCRYCLFAGNNGIERNHEHIFMSWDLAKRAIDYLYAHSQDACSITISFYGGEPLLNFDLIRNVVEYCNALFCTKNIDYVMTTNGTLLNENIVDFLATNRFLLSISVDVNENMQNSHRKFAVNGNNTFDIVRNNIEIIRNRHKEYFDSYVGFIPVLFEDEVYEYDKSLFYELGISEEKISVTSADMQGVDYMLKPETLKRISGDSNVNAIFGEKENKRMNDIFRNKSIVPQKWYPKGQCIPGVKRLFVDTEGAFYPCEKVIEQSKLSIGNIDEGLNVESVMRYLNIGQMNSDRCKKCWVLRFCSICIADCYAAEFGVCEEKKTLLCDKYASNTLKYLKQIISDAKLAM